MKVIIKEYERDEFGDYGKLINEYVVSDVCSFVYDNCHKIYIVEDNDDIQSVKELWGENEIFHAIEELPIVWQNSCPLRFIDNWKLNKYYVQQGNLAKFEFFE